MYLPTQARYLPQPYAEQTSDVIVLTASNLGAGVASNPTISNPQVPYPSPGSFPIPPFRAGFESLEGVFSHSGKDEGQGFRRIGDFEAMRVLPRPAILQIRLTSPRKA